MQRRSSNTSASKEIARNEQDKLPGQHRDLLDQSLEEMALNGELLKGFAGSVSCNMKRVIKKLAGCNAYFKAWL